MPLFTIVGGRGDWLSVLVQIVILHFLKLLHGLLAIFAALKIRHLLLFAVAVLALLWYLRAGKPASEMASPPVAAGPAPVAPVIPAPVLAAPALATASLSEAIPAVAEPSPATTGYVMLNATDTVHVRVTEANGHIILQALLRKGERVRLTGRPPYVVEPGRAGALQIERQDLPADAVRLVTH